jgi:uncharacterized protein YcbX
MSDKDIREPLPHQEDSIAKSVRVAQLWRYPVKSLQGERLSTLRVVDDGVEGDRAWVFRIAGRISEGDSVHVQQRVKFRDEP